MTDKIIIPLALSDVLQERQRKGEHVVFTNGCFDLLHIGHIRYLQSAKALGDVLVVAVNSDESVRSLEKGRGRPLNPVEHRMEVLAALACVDYVVRFDESTPLTVIETLQPDVLVKGGDWPVEQIVGREVVQKRGGMVKSISLTPNISTSLLIDRIQHMDSSSEISSTIGTRARPTDPSLADPSKSS